MKNQWVNIIALRLTLLKHQLENNWLHVTYLVRVIRASGTANEIAEGINKLCQQIQNPARFISGIITCEFNTMHCIESLTRKKSKKKANYRTLHKRL